MIDSYGQHDAVDQSEPVYEELSGGYKMTNGSCVRKWDPDGTGVR